MNSNEEKSLYFRTVIYIYIYIYIYTLIVHIKTTANKGDVFMIGSFLGGGGVPKKMRF